MFHVKQESIVYQRMQVLKTLTTNQKVVGSNPAGLTGSKR